MKLILKFMLGFCLVAISWTALQRPAQAQMRVVRIADGDTIVVEQSGQTEKVRLVCIDAPELSQPKWGEAAKQSLSRMAPPGSQVSLNRITTDRYGRAIAEVILPNQRSANLLLVQTGMAAVYRRYLNNCPNANAYVQAEKNAQQGKQGFWRDPSFVMPWDYKRSNPRN